MWRLTLYVPHSCGARPWVSTLIVKESEVMALWCLDGLPQGLAESLKELWKLSSGPLHCVPPFSPPAQRKKVKALPRILKVGIKP
uniref:Uncharacterized protein n=1 Tax=Urocitellus parryii TaxID=9999 RepID=A0A8D2KDD2_UROPR